MPNRANAVSQASGAPGRHGPWHAAREIAAVAGEVVVQGGGLRPAAETAHREHAVAAGAGGGAAGLVVGAIGEEDDDGRHAAEHRGLWLDDVQADAGGDAGVNGIATLLQYSQAAHRGVVMHARNHVPASQHGWAVDKVRRPVHTGGRLELGVHLL